jgi:hypothetical protein
MVALRGSDGDVTKGGSVQNVENSVCCIHQGLVEWPLRLTVFLAMVAVRFVVVHKFLVGFDRVNSRSPSGLPVVGDMQDSLHEDLKVNENSALHIFEDVVLEIVALVSIDSVRIAVLPLPDG